MTGGRVLPEDYQGELGDVVRDAEGCTWLFNDDEVINPWTGVGFDDAAETDQLPRPLTLLVRASEVVLS